MKTIRALYRQQLIAWGREARTTRIGGVYCSQLPHGNLPEASDLLAWCVQTGQPVRWPTVLLGRLSEMPPEEIAALSPYLLQFLAPGLIEEAAKRVDAPWTENTAIQTLLQQLGTTFIVQPTAAPFPPASNA